MSILALTRDRYSRQLGRGSRASSEESRAVREQLEDLRRHLHIAASAPQSFAYPILERVAAECSQPGWDGYNARPISHTVYTNARAFLNELPSWLPAPDVVPEADGEIAIEWELGPDRVFSVSIGERNELHYAGLFGGGVERHGVEPFEGVVSDEILRSITSLISGGSGITGSRRVA